MKNLNLVKRLWTDSHEKQSPQRFGRYAAMLFTLLTLGVGQMWGSDASDARIYYDNTTSQWTYVQLLGGHSTWSSGTALSLISGTNNLWTNTWSWGGYTYFMFIDASGSLGGEGNEAWNRKGEASHYSRTITTNVGSNTYLYTSTSTSDNTGPTETSISGYDALNYTQTLYQCVAENGGTPAKSTASIATIGITTKKLNSASSTTDDNGNITSGQNSVSKSAARTATVTMTATSIADGYSFLGWYDSETGGTRLESSTTYTYQATAAKTVYARFSHETTHSVAITYICASPSATVSTATAQAIGQVTASAISAPTVTGYTFVNWTLGSGVEDQGSDLTANPISVKTLSSGTYTMQANYTEDLTSDWKVVGGTNLTGNNWETEYAMTKKTGHSAESVVYYTFNIASTNSGVSGSANDWSFKIKNGSDWYGLSAEGSYWWTSSTTANQTLSTTGANIQVVANVSGNYEVKVDYSTPASPTVTVTFPTSYTLTYAIGDVKGNDGSISSSPSTSSGSYVASGSTVTLTAPNAATGYTWKGWYGAANGSGDQLCSTKAYAITVSANTTVYACYTEDDYDVTVNSSSATMGSVASSSVTGHISTSTTLPTATANKGYYFVNWTVTSGTATITNANNASGATINGMSDDVTVQANFAPIWRILGSQADNTSTGTDGFGGWNIDNAAAAIVNIGTNANSKDTGYVELPLEANKKYEFKMLDRQSSGTYYGNGGDKVYYMAYNNHTNWGFGTDKSYNCGITTAGAGTYRFAWNFTDKTMTVTFPTSYTVTFGYGTGGSEVTATVEDATTITSGQYAAAGKDITFTQTPAAGYTFKGWYDAASGGSAISSMASDDVYDDIAGNANIYAQYTEDMHTVTVLAGTHGTITTPVGGSGETVSAGIATSADIVAVAADYGYYFQGWTVESGTATIADASALSTTVTATSDATIKANFVSHWTIAGGDSEDPDGADAMGDWSTVINGIDNFTEISSGVWQGYADIVLPANTTFQFKVRDLYDGSAWYGNTGEMTYTNYENWSMTLNTANCRITTAGAGSYRFTWNETNKTLTVTFPTSYTVTYGKVADNGQDIGGVTVTGDDGATLETGKYVAKGSATFTAADAANYTFVDWRTSNTYGEGTQLSTANPYTMTSIAENKTVYAHYAENMTSVTLASTAGGHIEIGGATVTSTTAGAVTTRSITAVPDEGWYFAGWTVSDGADCAVASTAGRDDNASSSTTLRGLGAGTTGTVTANFVENDKIYFRNVNGETGNPLWNDVYVGFAAYWTAGTGCNGGECGAGVKVENTTNGGTAHMTQIGSSNVYWAYVPRQFTTSNAATKTNIAFYDTDMSDWTNFNGNNAVYRTDYNRALNMFVPNHTSSGTTNSTVYYSNGYWKVYADGGADAGYYIMRYNGSTYEDPADNGTGSNQFVVVDDNTIQYSLRIDNSGNDYNRFRITSAYGTKYITTGGEEGDAITTSNCNDNILLTEYNTGSPRFSINATSHGIYTITIDQSSDQMRITVNYPVAVGDYQLVHTYSSTKTTKSDIIKTTETGERRYSMYIVSISTHSPSLVLKKCTSLSAGSPVWSAGNAVSMTGFKSDTAGVFVFDVAIANDQATLSNIETYTGKYYIKTDCADGGWTAYTSNVMEENTISFVKSDASTYDYYYCKWVTSNNSTNVKCVIANEYCNALSDTIIGDDIIGGSNDVLPYDANVRFSYNSTTNQLKRAYINGATDWQRSFLNISADTLLGGLEAISGRSGNSWQNSTTLVSDSTFTDKNNWIYQLDLKTKAGARVKLTANYRYNDADHIQYFYGASGDYSKANTEEIVGGTTADWFTMRAVYDFKTNKLLVGLLANGDTYDSEKAINADLLVVRGNQSSAQQLTFGENGSLTKVDTVYGILQFDKTFLTDNSKTVYERSLYWVSFPFNVNLKDVFGFGEYGTHWILEYYDGAARAREKFWAESDGFWKFVTPAMRDTGYILQANVGYVVGLDLDYFAETNTTTWANGVTELSLYFPSNGRIGTIDNGNQDVVVPAHTCTETRDHRYIWDSNWNIIGVPSYANISGLVTGSGEQSLEEQYLNTLRSQLTGTPYSTNNLRFFYAWDPSTNALKLDAVASDSTFKTMYGYMVQYAGTITWSSSGGTLSPSPSAPRRDNAEQKEFYNIKLSVAQDGVDIDHAYIELRDDATETYDMNLDLVKAANKEMTNLYTLVDGVEMGGNCLPIANTVTIVPVGLRTVASTDYTFSLPDGSDGIEVTLIDYLNNTETNLSLGDYTTHIDQGTCNNRFALRLNRAKVVTAIEGAENGEMQSAGNEKVLIDGVLYIRQADGSVFDAQGKRIR